MSNTCSRADEYYINFLWASFFHPCCDWVIGLTSAGRRFPERCLVSELHLLVWWYKTNISPMVIRNSKLSHYGDKSMWTTSQSSLCWLRWCEISLHSSLLPTLVRFGSQKEGYSSYLLSPRLVFDIIYIFQIICVLRFLCTIAVNKFKSDLFAVFSLCLQSPLCVLTQHYLSSI